MEWSSEAATETFWGFDNQQCSIGSTPAIKTLKALAMHEINSHLSYLHALLIAKWYIHCTRCRWRGWYSTVLLYYCYYCYRFWCSCCRPITCLVARRIADAVYFFSSRNTQQRRRKLRLFLFTAISIIAVPLYRWTCANVPPYFVVERYIPRRLSEDCVCTMLMLIIVWESLLIRRRRRCFVRIFAVSSAWTTLDWAIYTYILSRRSAWRPLATSLACLCTCHLQYYTCYCDNWY